VIERTDHKTEGPADEYLLLQQLAGTEQEAYDAFTSLYEYYYEVLYTYIFPFARLSAVETKEIIQVVFVKLWLKRDTLTGVQHFRQYLFRMARNTVIDLQRQKRRQEKREGLVADRSEGRVNAVETELALKEYHHIARQAIELLPARRKAIFLLRTVGDLSLEEIGQELDVSKDVVKKQLYLAVDFIKKQIREKGDLIFFLLVVPFL
jgi:RNA polymerase sigma-70 factor (ECF subfamily)